MSTAPGTIPDPTSGGRFGIPASYWLLGPWKDLLLFVATPFLIIPAVLGLRLVWSTPDLALVVASFGAVGHHLPGMMRAYGDRALFARFKIRFILSPIVLFAFCMYGMFVFPAPVILAVYAWGVWHRLMQTHGFLRIYDAKAGSVASRTGWLDFSMCLSWFLLVGFLSPGRQAKILGDLYSVGVPVISLDVISFVRMGWIALTAVVTVAFIANVVRGYRTGNPPSPIKIALLITNVGLFAFCNLAISSLLLAVLMFEILHDAQYLGIVWLFNTKRVDADPEVGGFTRFVFRRRAWLVLLYLGLIAAYGALNVAYEGTDGMFKNIFGGLLTTSTLLHFYYDGFIWKIREKQTSESLGIAKSDKATVLSAWQRLPMWARHGLKCAALGAPLAFVLFRGPSSAIHEDDRIVAVAEVAPRGARVQYNLSTVLIKRGDLDGAIQATRRAFECAPNERPSTRRAGTWWGSQALNESDVREKARTNLTNLLVRRALDLEQKGLSDRVPPLLDEAAGLEPELLAKLHNVAALAQGKGQTAVARAAYGFALHVKPDDPIALDALAELPAATP